MFVDKLNLDNGKMYAVKMSVNEMIADKITYFIEKLASLK